MSVSMTICPACRALGSGPRCDADGTALLDLEIAEDRARLVEAVWGTPEQREALSRALRRPAGSSHRVVGATVGGTTMAVLYGLLSDWGSTGMLTFGIGGALVGAISATFRAPIRVPSPAAALPTRERFASGVIAIAPTLESPGSETPCVAWAIELRFDGSWGSRTTLRAGASLGFDVDLDGGERVRIPAGPLWLAGPLHQVDLETTAIESFLDDLDPLRPATDEWPLFSFNVVLEQTLRTGARVDVLGETVRELDATSTTELYRDAPASVLVPRGTPMLRGL